MMKKILIVNFTRMGDLLQSTPLIAGLKRKYPSSEISLAVLNEFRGICAGFPFVDRLIAVDFAHFLQHIQQSTSSLEDHYFHLKKLVSRAGDGYDLVINLSHSNLSAVYCLLTGCADLRGQIMTSEGAIIIRHPWMNYFFNVSRNRLYNSFNLVDMYNLTGDIELKERNEYYNIPEEAETFAQEFLKGVSGKLIGFQLGASSEDKRWDPELFGQLAAIIQNKLNWNIIVFGQGEESALFERMRKVYSGPVINAINQTNLSGLAALLKKCRLLITNDTGTMHLATAVGTGVIVLDLGEALAADTGPYTSKALVLEANIPCAPCNFKARCLDQQCHRYITPENVFWAIENFERLTQGEVEQIPDQSEWSKIKISRPLFEADGFWYLLPLIRRPLEWQDLIKGFYRRLWKKFLHPLPDLVPTDFEQYYLPPSDPDFNQKLEALISRFEQLCQFGRYGLNIALKLRENLIAPDIYDLKRLSREMVLLDNSIYQLELTTPELAPIATYFRLRKNSSEQDDLAYIANMAEILYRDLQTQAQIMMENLSAFTASQPQSLGVLLV